MAAFSWLPLELWRAGALAQETKAVIGLYEDVANSGDAGSLAALRASIEDRIDALEGFYMRSSDDERAVLFEKQRLKLRKLLHEYDAYAASVGGGAAAAPPASPSPPSRGAPASPSGGSTRGGADGGLRGTYHSAAAGAASTRRTHGGGGAASVASGGVATRVIREDSRLTLPELTAWFEQAGADEMPEVTTGIVGRVFASITRTNADGKLSIRDLRQWYITFGRHTLAAAIAAGADPEAAITPGAAGGAGATIVSVPVMQTLNVRLATTATKAIVGGKVAGAGAGGRRASSKERPLYAWEQPGGAAAGGAAGAPLDASAGPAPPAYDALPNGLLEFQVVLTPEEHAAVGRLRRAMEAEGRYRARMEAAQAKSAARRGAGSGASGWGWDGAASGLSVGGEREAYSEPLTRDAAALLTRSS